VVNPTPLEEPHRIPVGAVELMEALTATQLGRDKERRVSPTYLLQTVGLQESANRRYLMTIKTLTQVRKLQANTPAVHSTTLRQTWVLRPHNPREPRGWLLPACPASS
jgi:hypothetical protein